MVGGGGRFRQENMERILQLGVASDRRSVMMDCRNQINLRKLD
jgi:hypothetical protein